MIVGFVAEDVEELRNHLDFIISNNNKKLQDTGKLAMAMHISSNPFGECLMHSKKINNLLYVVLSFGEQYPAFSIMPKAFTKWLVISLLKYSFRKKGYKGFFKKLDSSFLINLFIFGKKGGCDDE